MVSIIQQSYKLKGPFMKIIELVAHWISVLSFLGYGLHCLFSEKMVIEFKRYGLEKFRYLTGVLEVLGALGLMAGLFYPLLMVISSAGLALLMFLGILTRLRIKDPVLLILPAFILFCLNLLIFIRAALW